jgi:hypothetical protein
MESVLHDAVIEEPVCRAVARISGVSLFKYGVSTENGPLQDGCLKELKPVPPVTTPVAIYFPSELLLKHDREFEFDVSFGLCVDPEKLLDVALILQGFSLE